MRNYLILTGIVILTGFTWAGDLLDRDGSSPVEHDQNVFNFVRIRYNGFIGSWSGGRRWGQPPWAHDYPRAEQNFLKILAELTTVETRPDSYLILDLKDPEIMNYPILYVSEPGYWNCTEEEADNLREYMDRGGFVIFDDFRDAPGEWNNFTGCMKMVYPERVVEELTVDHPVFPVCKWSPTSTTTLETTGSGRTRAWPRSSCRTKLIDSGSTTSSMH